MIRSEMLSENLIRHYSDVRKKIKQVETDIIYDEAIDVMPCRYAYEETEIPIDEDDISSEELRKALEEIL